jgi:hypothetical protein
MIITNNSKKKSIDERKLFEMLNEIDLTEEEFQASDVTDKDIKIIKAKVYNNIGLRQKKKIIKRIAIAASIAIVLCVPFLNVTALADIKNLFQFIPGIGMVQKTSSGGNYYMLTKMISKSYGSGKIIINGFDIDNKNATLSIDGDNISYFNSVQIENSDGTVYNMNEFSRAVYNDRNKLYYWSKTYKYSGAINPGKNYTIILNKRIKIPMSLVAINDIKDLNNLGPTLSINGINLTALSSIEGDKLKVDLLAPQNSGDKILFYPDSNISLNDEKHIPKDDVNGILAKSPIYLTDNTTNKYPAYMSPNVALGEQEYFFKTGNDITKQYTLTISKILMEYNSNTPLSVDLPPVGESSPNQIVSIAGCPVDVSIKKISATEVRVSVNVNYNKDLKNNLISFNLSSPDIVDNSMYSTGSMNSDLSSSPDCFEFSINKNTQHLNLHFNHPQIEIQGPWSFNIKLKR